ncbi:MAG: alpha-galactosidase [Bacteroidales bacterium]|nr:alpha-galactosidase [Bacteroidales bacterium]
MMNANLKIVGTFLLCAMFSALVHAENAMISIETDNVSMIMGTDNKGELLFRHFGGRIGDISQFAGYKTYRRSDYGTDPLAYPAAGGRFFNEPALLAEYGNGHLNTELKYVSHKSIQVDGNVTRTEILLQDRVTSLRVLLVYTAYAKEDVIVCHTEITNGGKKPVLLKNYYSSSLPVMAGKYHLMHFYGSWAREMQVDTEPLSHGIKTIESKKGVRTTHTENPSFMLGLNADGFDENHGEVIAGALAWSGNFKISFQMDETDRVNILAGINPYASEYRLDKGKTFVTPEMIYTYSFAGTGQASRNLHDWARNYGCYDSSVMCPTLLNSWEGAYFDFNTKTLTDMIDDVRDMGLEMFVLDDGWFGNAYPRNDAKHGLGDWETNVAKLPEGIGYLVDYAHERGVKFGIWIEPEMVNPESELARKHPEWIVKSEGREVPTIRTQWLLDLSNPDVQDFVFGVFDRTMQLAPGIDYIKWDANRHVESFGSEYLERQNHFFVEYVQGFRNVLRRLREKYPEVIVQACASGGGRVEYGALKYFNEVWTSDNTEALSRVFIQYGTNMIYPACVTGSHVSAVPNHQTGNVTPLKFRFDVASAGRLGMELQPKDMTDDEKEFAKMAIASYKEYRDLVFGGDLYRLMSPYESGDHYALMYVSKDKKRAVVFAYCIKFQGRTLIPVIRLHGLDTCLKYSIRELNVKKSRFWGSGKVFGGDYLTSHGINPQLTKIYDSSVFYLEAEN